MISVAELSLHKDPKQFRVGEMSSRAYFIPFESEESTYLRREDSKYFYSLNGSWRFLYKDSLYDMEDFYIDGYESDEFCEISVPEMWQLHGADSVQYQTSPYTFIFDPPHVPEKNPCAAYIKDFDMAIDKNKKYELHFEGKDSCIYVWMNGEFVGYGECPHSDSFFDVTKYLKDGENRLCVLVLKFCSGSYLDDQDKIRLSGIFRDVYLLERSEGGLADISIRTKNDGTVSVTSDACYDTDIKIIKDGVTLAQGKTERGIFVATVYSPILWSAEKPELYDLFIFCAGEYMRFRFGFREVDVKDSIFKVNGKHVKLYGVNRHDSAPDTGYAIDYEFIRNELIMMKQHNINAIRTSHYPNDPRFYELCDELGFYVMSEADMECHGCTYVRGWDKIITEPTYADAIHDRMERMYESLKNFTCIFCWSLGNESSWGENLKNEAIYVKSKDTSRLLHYEGWKGGDGDAGDATVLTDEEREFIKNTFSFHSRMYPSFEKMRMARSESAIGMAYLMCEYGSALGNSCGDLRLYDDIIQSSLVYAGGFIWEWCDHSIRIKDENGIEFFGYGGDFGEKHHRSNVCIDGLVSPDRQAHSSLLEVKAVFSRMRIEYDGKDTLTFINRHAFTDLCEYDFLWSVSADGEKKTGGVLDVRCDPYSSTKVKLPEYSVFGKDKVLTVKALVRKDRAWADKGHTVFAASFRLEDDKEEIKEMVYPIPAIYEKGSTLEISGEGFLYRFRRDDGLLHNIVYDGKELLSSPVSFNCFRAPTDNDDAFDKKSNIAVKWKNDQKFGDIEFPETSAHNFRCEIEGNSVCVREDFIFAVQGRMHISEGSIEYRIFGDGRIRITQNAKISDIIPYWLPRYGYELSFAKELSDITYFGYGPVECYEDKRTHALLGRYKYVQDEPYGAYEKPQENGSHVGTEWIAANTNGQRFCVRANTPFSFCASRYGTHTLAAARHKKDLVKSEGSYLYIDYRMSGIGSGSLRGEHPISKYRIEPSENIAFSIDVYPLNTLNI